MMTKFARANRDSLSGAEATSGPMRTMPPYLRVRDVLVSWKQRCPVNRLLALSLVELRDVCKMPHRRAPMRAVPGLVHRSHMLDDLYIAIRPSAVNITQMRELTEVIWLLFKGLPTITLLRQALIANIARALEHLTICPAGRSCIRCSSSSRSAGITLVNGAQVTRNTRRTFHVKRRALADGLGNKVEFLFLSSS